MVEAHHVEPGQTTEPKRAPAPPALLSLFLVCGVLAVAGASLVVGAPLLVAALCGVLCLLLVVVRAEAVLLLILLFRPVLSILPELEIGGQQIGVDGIINLLITAGFALVLPLRKQAPLRKPYLWITAAFLAVGLLSLRNSTDAVFGFRQWFRFFGYLVVFWLAYTAAARDERFASRVKSVVVMLSVVLLAMGALQMLFLLGQLSVADYVSMMLEPGLVNRLDGFQDVPHVYGNMLMVCTPVLLWAAWTARTALRRIALYALAMGCVVAMVYTGVRSVVGALAVAMTILLLGTRRLGMLALFALLFVVVGFGSGVFQARFDELLNPKRAVEWHSLEDRKEIWYLIDVASEQNRWGGYGLGSVYDFVASSPLRHNIKSLSTHCDYRKFRFECGIPGFLLFVLMWLSIVLAGWFGHGASNTKQYLCTAVAGLGAGFMCIALVDEIMQDYASMALFWTLAGVAFGLKASDSPSEEAPAEVPEAA